MPEGNDAVRFECQKCGACCRRQQLLITLNGRDIVRIARALGLESDNMLKIVDFMILPQGATRPEGLLGTPSAETERGPAVLALKKMRGGDCAFLENSLCLIHAARPSVCRSFPFVFRRDSEGTYWGLSAQKEICPGLDHGPEVEERQLSSLAAAVLDDMDAYAEFVNEWNEGEPSPTAQKLIAAILMDSRFRD